MRDTNRKTREVMIEVKGYSHWGGLYVKKKTYNLLYAMRVNRM